MKSTFRSIALVSSLVVVAGVHKASAPIDNALEFTTSFQFTVGNTTLPAGRYSIAPAEDDPQVLEHERRARFRPLSDGNRPADQAACERRGLFSRSGNQYILKNIWTAGSNIGYVTENALGERHIAKHADTSGESRVAVRKTASRAK